MRATDAVAPRTHPDTLAARAAAAAPLRRTREALPRQLQATMEELLAVNERYHAALAANRQQAEECAAAREALASAEARIAAQEEQLARAKELLTQSDDALATLRGTNAQLGTRAATSETEGTRLHTALQTCTQRLDATQEQLTAALHRADRAEAAAARQWQAGFEEGMARHKLEHRGAMRAQRERAQEEAREAFELGRQQHASDQSAALLREQAHRRLLLHRAEEARAELGALQQRLQRELSMRHVAQARPPRTHRRAGASPLPLLLAGPPEGARGAPGLRPRAQGYARWPACRRQSRARRGPLPLQTGAKARENMARGRTSDARADSAPRAADGGGATCRVRAARAPR